MSNPTTREEMLAEMKRMVARTAKNSEIDAAIASARGGVDLEFMLTEHAASARESLAKLNELEKNL